MVDGDGEIVRMKIERQMNHTVSNHCGWRWGNCKNGKEMDVEGVLHMAATQTSELKNS